MLNIDRATLAKQRKNTNDIVVDQNGETSFNIAHIQNKQDCSYSLTLLYYSYRCNHRCFELIGAQYKNYSIDSITN